MVFDRFLHTKHMHTTHTRAQITYTRKINTYVHTHTHTFKHMHMHKHTHTFSIQSEVYISMTYIHDVSLRVAGDDKSLEEEDDDSEEPHVQQRASLPGVCALSGGARRQTMGSTGLYP